MVTDRCDVTADHVVTELDGRRVPVFRFDTAEFPRCLSVSARLDVDHSSSLRSPSRSITLAEVGAVYYRRPRHTPLNRCVATEGDRGQPPADTPAAVTYLPSNTTRSPVGSTPNPRSTHI
jgi:hypothetical protein